MNDVVSTTATTFTSQYIFWYPFQTKLMWDLRSTLQNPCREGDLSTWWMDQLASSTNCVSGKLCYLCNHHHDHHVPCWLAWAIMSLHGLKSPTAYISQFMCCHVSMLWQKAVMNILSLSSSFCLSVHLSSCHHVFFSHNIAKKWWLTYCDVNDQFYVFDSFKSFWLFILAVHGVISFLL